jgi:hypothetical protein
MNNAYISALAALAGSGIGVLASVGTTWLSAIKIGANAPSKSALGSSSSLASSSIRPRGCSLTR